jgi:hypothetical protein
MTNTQVAVVGKVSQGRMTTLAVAGNRVVGQVRPLHTRTQVAPVLVTATHIPHTQEVSTYEPIDSPFISMVQANHIRMREEKAARIEAITIENKRNKRINMIKALFR